MGCREAKREIVCIFMCGGLRLAIGEDEAHAKDARGSRDYPPVQDLAVLIEQIRVIETKGIFRG